MKNLAPQNGELPANAMPGITKDLRQLRANPKCRCLGKWGNNGGTRTPLMAALLKMRGLIS